MKHDLITAPERLHLHRQEMDHAIEDVRLETIRTAFVTTYPISNRRLVLRVASSIRNISERALRMLAHIANVPASYVVRIPPTLAAQNINHGLAQLEGEIAVVEVGNEIIEVRPKGILWPRKG